MSGSKLALTDAEALLEGVSDEAATPNTNANSASSDKSDREGANRATNKSRQNGAGSASTDKRNQNGAHTARQSRGNDHNRSGRDAMAQQDEYVPLNDQAPRSGSDRSRQRQRSRSPRRDQGRRRDYRDRDDRYRDSRSSRDADRFYRPPSRRNEPPRRYHDRDYEGDRRSDAPRRSDHSGSKSPEVSAEDRDRRTVFVSQLANRVRERDVNKFFEGAGLKVKTSSIVKDRVSQRSKGIGYVEFEAFDSVAKALNMTGHKVLGQPIIVQETEAEKNRAAAAAAIVGQAAQVDPDIHQKLYVGNIHFSIEEDDLRSLFEPFGELVSVRLTKDETGRSRGYGFVHYKETGSAAQAVHDMHGFMVAQRAIRVILGGDKFNNESARRALDNQPGQHGRQDRAPRRDGKRDQGTSSALDDTDISGVKFTSDGRSQLMQKLARVDETDPTGRVAMNHKAAPTPAAQKPVVGKCVCLQNMFDPEQETEPNWVQDIEEDVRIECNEKYGHVVHVFVEATGNGNIYVKFDHAKGGENAMNGLNGRKFAGRLISVKTVSELVYNQMFPNSGP